MERVTLYYRGLPVSHHKFSKESFSIGASPSNDLVLAGAVTEESWVIRRAKSGKWRVERHADENRTETKILENGERIDVGPYEVGVEPQDESSSNLANELGASEAAGGSRLGWAGRSAAMHQLRTQTERLAPLNAPVLIRGESGSGKELVARGLHLLSRRQDGPFVAVNCGGFTDSLLEDTLFGHDKGAFTGAAARKRGVFEQAHNGTLFLDEIGDLPLMSQAALLRVLEEKRICRIGSEQSIAVDFRLVTATHRDLKAMVRKHQFRLDLFHRISTLCIETFALRDHAQDIDDISVHFFAQHERELGPRRLSPSALEKASAYAWPGNVRELGNVLYRAAAVNQKTVLEAEDLDIPVSRDIKKPVQRLTRLSQKHLAEVLAGHNGNIAAAARTLGVPRTSLRDRIKSGNLELLQRVDLAV